MSAGVFVSARYAASYAAEIHPIRVQPETIAASIGGTSNGQPGGALSSPISAIVSATSRQLGLHPRAVYIRASDDAGNVPEGYKPGGITRIPALQEAFWNAAIKGATVSYLGEDFTVVSRVPENAR